MEYSLFECSTRYLTCSLRSLVRYKVEHEKIQYIPYLEATMYYFVYYYINILVPTFLPILQRFLTTFKRFSKNWPRATQKFPNFSRTFLEDYQKIPTIIPKIFEEDLNIFRSCTNRETRPRLILELVVG